ncbi:WD40-repeat-containing domain protein [Cladochytrium replicatum]|nr:WD40-repeat-containing domain protein [Cladochytrium replicatum]
MNKRLGEEAGGALVKRARQEDLVQAQDGSGALIKTIPRTSGLQAPIMHLTGHEADVRTCRFSPDGNTIASGSLDRNIFLWNTYGDCKNFGVLKGHGKAVLEMQWMQGGSQIVSASADTTLGLWDVKTCERVKRMKGHNSFVNSVSVSPRGSEIIATGSDDNTIKVWDVRTKNAVDTFNEPYQVTAVCWSSDGGLVFSGGIDTAIKAWDVRKKAVAYTMEGHGDIITGLRLSSDGGCLLSSSMDNTVRIWDVKPFAASGTRMLKSFEGATQGFEHNLIRPCWSNDGEYVACGSGDRSVVVWEVTARRIVYKLPGHKGCVNDVDWHPSEPILMSCSSDKTLFLGELEVTELA